MKVMLCNAPWHKIDSDGKTGRLGCRAGSRWPHMRDYHGSMVSRYQPFPFFLATASAMLKEAGFQVILRDSIVIGEHYQEFYDFAEARKPDLILLEVSTPSISNDLTVIGHLKARLPHAKFAVSGLHAPISEKNFLEKNPSIDFAVYGEYEHPLLLLAQALQRGSPLENVPNLVYRHGDDVRITPREPLLPMSALPWPDRESLPPAYYDGCGGMMGPELQIHTSRGCPFQCNFCVLPQVIYAGPSYRMRSPEDVVAELRHHLGTGLYTHFYIDDDTINIHKPHFMELCRLIAESGLSEYPWACMGRGDLMDDEMLHALKNAGCYAIKYGVESFNEGVLRRSGKALNMQKNIETIKKTQALGIKVHLTYCLGMLGDTIATVEDTIAKSLALQADSRQYSIATPFVGSRLWMQYKQMGLLMEEDPDRYDANHDAVVSQEGLPAQELIRLKAKAELLSKEQILHSVSSQFRTPAFSSELASALEGTNRLLLTGTARRSIVMEIGRLARGQAQTVHILTHQKYAREYSGFPPHDLITFDQSDRFCKESMSALICGLNQSNYDAVVIPCRTFTSAGMENVIEVARAIAEKVILVYGHGKVETQQDPSPK